MTSPAALPSRRLRPSSTRAAALCSFLWAISAFTETALAAPTDLCQADPSCRKQVTAATQLAAKSHYDEALALYQAAYAQSHEPRLLLNIGRCQYRLNQLQQALDSYATFRRSQPSLDPELSSRLNQFVAEAKLAVLTAEKDAEKNRAAEAVANEPEPPPAPLLVNADKKTLFGRPAWRVGAGIGAAAVGGLLIGLGIGALAANGSCLTPSLTMNGQCATQLDPSGMRTTVVLNGVTAGVPMLITGVLLFTGGVLLFALPNRSKKYALRTPIEPRTGFTFAFGAP